MVKLRTEGVGIKCVGFKGLGVKGVGCKVRSWRVGGAEWGKDWWESQGTCSHHNLFVNVYFVLPWRLGHKEHFWMNKYAQWQPV